MISLKKYIHILCILTTIILGVTWANRQSRVQTLFLPLQGTMPITPENTIIAFDIHAVLVEKNSGDMWKIGLKNIGGLRFAFNKKIRTHIKGLGKDAAPEDYLLPLLPQIPKLDKYIPGFLNLINAQDKLPGSKRIIEKLSAHRFKLYVLSNIGPAAYYGWQSPTNSKRKATGLKEIHSDIFKHFSGELIAAKKPNAQGYMTFAEKFAQCKGKKQQIIFVDDRKENIDEAVAQGFIGIWFKDAMQLQNDLMRLGIII